MHQDRKRLKVRRNRHLPCFRDFAFELVGEFQIALVNPMAIETRPGGWIEVFLAINLIFLGDVEPEKMNESPSLS
jgi:hypothetical protein